MPSPSETRMKRSGTRRKRRKRKTTQAKRKENEAAEKRNESREWGLGRGGWVSVQTGVLKQIPLLMGGRGGKGAVVQMGVLMLTMKNARGKRTVLQTGV